MAETGLNILVTGGAGQVGIELARASWPAGTHLHRPSREALDLSDARAVQSAFASNRFDAVVNAAAYTAVDLAEIEVGAAFAANALGPALLADACRQGDIPLLHVSTDYVFDGTLCRPYREDHPIAPLGVYGAAKLAGELAVMHGHERSLVLRTAWVVSAHRANFLKTMLRLRETQSRISVVDDQVGCPTSAADLAGTLSILTQRMIADHKAPTGVFHFVNAGETTWCGLAREIFAGAKARGFAVPIVDAVTTAEYPTRASRPANSRLSTARLNQCYGIAPRPWRDGVSDILDELLDKKDPTA